MSDERSAYDEKLESILRTAAAIFAEKGYHQASIRDIARGTGVSLSGLYYYFDSKEELLFLIQDHAFGTLLGSLEQMLEGVDEPHRRLRILMENHLRYFVGAQAEMKLLSHEGESLTGDYRRTVNAKKRRLTDLAGQILREVRPGGDVDARVATFSLFGMMNWLYNWYRPGVDVPLERLVDDMYRIFLHGYLPDGAQVPEGADAATGETRPIWRTVTA
ncbi:MAG TPA: TetR/AcrR family transcriptional regulator [Longimicrobiaceae bacterium]|nr:TetR/AcrR family transcriptional regulator [Longimicrobiaceae bacterium]